MFSLRYWKAGVCLLFASFTLACTSAEEVPYGGIEQPLVAFDFTPVPTSTSVVGVDEGAAELSADSFTIQVENVVIESEQPAIQMVDSAETNATIQEEEEEPVDEVVITREVQPPMVNRSVLKTSITASRNAISNLTYTINVANGVGSLSCVEMSNFYQDVLEFEVYTAPSALAQANDTYTHALDMSVNGVAGLFDLCTNFLNESAFNDGININEIEPDVWQRAVSDSNEAIRSAENAVGWLKGQAKLLRILFDQVDTQIQQADTLVSNAQISNCKPIRQAFEQTVTQATYLDLGGNAKNGSSYNKYVQALERLDAGFRALYEYCASDVGGMGQFMDSNGIDAHFSELAVNASRGVQQAQELMELADFYITPPTAVPPTAVPTKDTSHVIVPTVAPIVVEPTKQATQQAVWTNTSSEAQALSLFVISTQQSAQAHIWEIVIGFNAAGGVGPFTLLTGGELNGNNSLLVAQTCDRNFRDSVSVRDANGQLFRSEKIEVTRDGVCQ
ncbi:MAG: hypothetical protein ACPG8W_03460 [Candidatus Promineifilaceae bacterium]